MSDPGLLVVADMHGLAGRAGELRGALDELAAGSRGEPGCRSFRVFAADEPGELLVLSAWTDEAALRAHYATVHYRRYRDLVGPLLARASDVTVHQVSGTVRARDPNPPDPGMLG